jgi:MFS family permease
MSRALVSTLPAPWSRARLMGTLFGAQVCGSAGHSIVMAVGGIMAAEITGTNAWTGLPVAIAGLGMALASWPLAAFMARAGRRRGLVLGYALAVAGAVLGMDGVLLRSFPLFLVGMGLFGIANTSNLLARYAAADITPGARRGQAMGLIIWGSTAGSIIGPNLMGLATEFGRPFGLSAVGSAFLISLIGYSAASLTVWLLLRPDPLTIARLLYDEPAHAATREARSLTLIFQDVRVRIALGTLMCSQLVMIGTTSTSPVHLHDHGHHVLTIGLAVSIHLGGMYIASPLSGWLSDRVGRLPIIGVGGLVLVGAMALAGLVPGSHGGWIMLGLFLNGVGWNLAFVAGSALLTDALSPAERTSIQGMADLMMGLMGAVGSTIGGLVLGAWGFFSLNALGTAVVLGSLILAWIARPTLLLSRMDRSRAEPSTP